MKLNHLEGEENLEMNNFEFIDKVGLDNNLLSDQHFIGQQNKSSAQFARFARFASSDRAEDLMNTKTIPVEVYENLPDIFKQACSVFETQREKDVFLTGGIGILSGCFTNIKGLYASEEHYPNLNCFITAPAASGKGPMKYARTLGVEIHEKKLSFSEKLRKQALKEKLDSGKIIDTPQKLLFIPANSSTSAIIRHLSENEGTGIICETEADTMAEALKQDWSSYSDMIRKAFHHEPVSSSRKTQREYYELRCPKLSTVLSGTPEQAKSLLKSSENGLFSRMIFYNFNGTDRWRSVAPKPNKLSINSYFKKLSLKVKSYQDYFLEREYEFNLTKSQWEALDIQFESWLDTLTTFVHSNTSSIVKRLGLIMFRIAMVMSILRHVENGQKSTDIICSDTDFRIAQILSGVYLEHALVMFFKLPRESKLHIDESKRSFFDALPEGEIFARAKAIEIGKKVKISERTADKYLKRFLEIKYLNQPEYGKYQKC